MCCSSQFDTVFVSESDAGILCFLDSVFFFDYVFSVGLNFYSSVPLLVPQDGVLVAVVVVLYISKMVSWLTAMMMGLACL